MTQRFLRASAILTLLALGLMVWSVIVPTPLPVMLAMSLGQMLGTAAFAMYGWVVLRDLRRLRASRRRAGEPGAVPGAADGASEVSAPAASADPPASAASDDPAKPSGGASS